MDSSFWHRRWEKGEIGFHQSQVNSALVENLSELHLDNESRLFLPLCGKTHDIGWLLAQGYRVAGAELSPLAINELFQALDVTPQITPVGELLHYSAPNIDIWVGDIFNLSANVLGSIDGIYDRAALVALPLDMRQRYTAHLTALTQGAQQLLVTYEYDQRLHDGPPFSVHEQELKRHYDNHYQLKQLAHEEVVGGLRGKVPAATSTWHLRK